MKRMFTHAALLGSMLIGTNAQAQTLVTAPDAASNALGQCLVLKTNGADRLLVARWLAAAIGAGDATKDVLTVDDAGKNAADKAMAGLYTRLFTIDCAEQAAPLIRAQSQSGIAAAAGMLGEMAMRELLSDAKVAAAMGAYTKFIDPAKFAALTK